MDLNETFHKLQPQVAVFVDKIEEPRRAPIIPERLLKDYCVLFDIFPGDARIEMYRELIWPGLIYIILAACLQTRKLRWKDKCYGRPGVPVPVNIIEQQADRGIFMSVFALIGSRLQEIILNGPAFAFAANAPSLIKIPVALFAGCLSGVVFYPIIAPLTTPHPITYFFGTLYTWYTLFFVLVTHKIPCHEFVSPLIWAFHIISISPLCVAYFYLAMKFPWRFYQSVRGTKKTYKSYHKKRHDYQFYHVKQLFAKPVKVKKKTSILPGKQSLPRTIIGIFWSKEPRFSYSLCFLAGITFTLAFIWMATLTTLESTATQMKRAKMHLGDAKQFLFGPQVQGGLKYADSIMNITVQLGLVELKYRDLYMNAIVSTMRYGFDYIITYFNYLEYSLYMTIILTFAATANALFLSVQNHKRHMLQIYRGQVHKGLWKYTKQLPGATIATSLKYMGYQFGFTIWAFLIQLLVMIILALPLAVFLMLILFQKQWVLLLWPAKHCLLPVFWVSVIVWTQKRIARLFFLQKNQAGKFVLAIDNRRAFFNMQYFMIFANAAVGLIACLKRLFYALLFGLWNLPRLDTSTLNRFWERWDNGFMAYVGLLNLQNSLTNPCMVVFVKILKKGIEQNGEKLDDRRLRARNRWFLAITLLNNPWLRVKRYEYLKSIKGRQVLMSEMTNCFLKQAILNSQMVALPGISVSPSESIATSPQGQAVQRALTRGRKMATPEKYASSSEDEKDTEETPQRKASFMDKLMKKI